MDVQTEDTVRETVLRFFGRKVTPDLEAEMTRSLAEVVGLPEHSVHIHSIQTDGTHDLVVLLDFPDGAWSVAVAGNMV